MLKAYSSNTYTFLHLLKQDQKYGYTFKKLKRGQTIIKKESK